MTKEEYLATKAEIDKQEKAARDVYHAQTEQLQQQLDAIKAEYIKVSPFQIGDVVMARHMRGYERRPPEKCQVTGVRIYGYDGEFSYTGVKTKADGSFGSQVDSLVDVQPYTEQ